MPNARLIHNTEKNDFFNVGWLDYVIIVSLVCFEIKTRKCGIV